MDAPDDDAARGGGGVARCALVWSTRVLWTTLRNVAPHRYYSAKRHAHKLRHLLIQLAKGAENSFLPARKEARGPRSAVQRGGGCTQLRAAEVHRKEWVQAGRPIGSAALASIFTSVHQRAHVLICICSLVLQGANNAWASSTQVGTHAGRLASLAGMARAVLSFAMLWFERYQRLRAESTHTHSRCSWHAEVFVNGCDEVRQVQVHSQDKSLHGHAMHAASSLQQASAASPSTPACCMHRVHGCDA